MLTPYSRQNTNILPFPFAPNKGKILGKMFAALDIQENTNNKESHILNNLHVAGFVFYM